jgi:hypothetical protein
LVAYLNRKECKEKQNDTMQTIFVTLRRSKTGVPNTANNIFYVQMPNRLDYHIGQRYLSSKCKNIVPNKNIDKTVIYTTLLNACLLQLKADKSATDKEKSIMLNLENFVNEIAKVVSYMLTERFIPSKPKKRQVRRTRKVQTRDLALFNYETIQKKQKPSEINSLDIITAFKLLENFMLRRTYISTLDNLKLGQFKSNISQLFDMLPKLLLAIDGVSDEKARTSILNILFSSVIIYRQFKVKTKPSATTITAAYNGTRDLDALCADDFSIQKINNWLLGLDVDKREVESYSRLSIYSGNASSPNGGASSANLLKDIAAINNDPLLHDAIRKLASNFKGWKEFDLLLETLILNVSIDQKFGKDAVHSRLFHFTAPGGKSRVIANVDWITQTSLSAIHFSLFKLLSMLKADCTFDHKSGINLHEQKNDNAKSSGENYYSIDLSAATDRMPRKLQAQLIAAIWNWLGFNGGKIAEQWLIIVDREYNTKKSGINDGKPVRYSVGQGMGLFSSWVSMAITHHYIVNCLCGINMANYRLVGDDLLIKGSEDQFERYLAVMKAIGLEVNLNKTIVSTNTSQHNVEFARNYVISGCRITPLPFGQMYAWMAGMCPFETSVGIIATVWTVNTLACIIHSLCDISEQKRIEIAYFLYARLGIEYEMLPFIDELTQQSNFKWLTKANFERILQILSEKEDNSEMPTPIGLNTVGFLNALRSQCTMRNMNDLLKSKEVSESVVLLQFADDRLMEASNLFYERLIYAQLLAYDLEDLGTPLLTKREKRLLADILNKYKTKVKKNAN